MIAELKPFSEYKESGLSWPGKVPGHWGTERAQRLFTSQNIHFGELRLDKVAYISPQVHTAMSNAHVMPKDVLLNITGVSIGRVCAVPEHIKDANVNQHMCIIRPIPRFSDSEYLAMFLATETAQAAIYIAHNGSSREGIAVSAVKSLSIVFPPLVEQRMIGERIHQDILGVRDVVFRLEREIDLLCEYHTRLVANVVTGKLDVRKASLRLPSETPLDAAEEDVDLEYEAETYDKDAVV